MKRSSKSGDSVSAFWRNDAACCSRSSQKAFKALRIESVLLSILSRSAMTNPLAIAHRSFGRLLTEGWKLLQECWYVDAEEYSDDDIAVELTVLTQDDLNPPTSYRRKSRLEQNAKTRCNSDASLLIAADSRCGENKWEGLQPFEIEVQLS